MKQACSDCDRLCEVVKHLSKTILLCLVLCKHPRCCLVDVFVAAAEKCEYLCDGICHTKSFHFLCHFISCAGNNSLKICVNGSLICIACCACALYDAVKIFIAHGNCTIHQITECIGKLGIGTLRYKLPCNVPIVIKRHLMQYIVTDSIDTKEVYQVISINHISLGLTHLIVIHQ